ncbi:hypothetical protein A4A49_65327, partial [Nicotiana attenuata]
LLTDRESNWDKKINISISWTKPPTGWYKLNIDGAFDKAKASGGIGGIIRNHHGDWMIGYASKITPKTPIHAELMALHLGLIIANKRKLLPLEIETDATQVISFINNGCKAYDTIINSYRLLLARMDQVVLHHNFRQGSEVAHNLAKHAEILPAFNKMDVWSSPPPFVLARMLAD